VEATSGTETPAVIRFLAWLPGIDGSARYAVL